MSKDTKNFIITLLIASCIAIPFTMWMDSCSKKQRAEHDANVRYEIEILDKYDCLGSNYHLIGGRTTEQEYHIIYKVTPLTEAAKKEYYGDGEEDDEVDYKVYRKIEVGKKFTGTRSRLFYYY